MAPKPTMSELRADAAADAKMEGAVEAQTEAQLMQSYPKAKPDKPAGTILRDAMDAVKSTIAAGARPISPRAAQPGSSKDVDAMSDGSFEKVEEDVVMVTEADYDLAEKVATQHKNEEDSAALELAGQTTEDFTFLAEASHLDVQKSLADLEVAIAKLSTKDTEETKVSEESSTLPGPAQGDQGEGSVSKDTFVVFDRTPAGSYKITNTATDWPLVPGHIRSKLRNFTIGELYDLVSIFKEATSLTESTFHRILEVYALQVMKLQHTHILEADHVRKRDASVVHKLDPGAEISDQVCASCKAPWIQQTMEGKCLGCGQVSSAIPALEATGLQLTVDGVQWTLKAGTKGSVWLPEEGQEQLKALKRDATINAGDMVTALPLARVESEPTYSDSVPPGQRLTLREMVTSNELLDDAQFQGLELGNRPPVRSDFKDGQQALFFHPQAAKALRLQVQLKEAPPEEKETVEQKMAKEEASLQTIAAMQEGAHEVPQSEARGAAILRHLDMGKFEGYLKRKYEAPERCRDTWSQITMAQTSLAEAKESNRKWQEEHRGRTLALKPLPDINLWTPRVQEILQSGSLCEAQLDYLVESDIRAAQSACLDLKKLIKEQGNPRPGSLLLKEVPQTELDIFEASGGTGALAQGRESFPSVAVKFPKDSEERKVAILDIINAHEGKSVRIWGGQWRKKWTTMEIPSWASEAKPGQLAQLERCTRPYGPEGDFHEFCRFTEEELADQVRLGTRPAEDTIVKMFWAPGGEGWHWHRGFAALVQRLAHAATLKEIYGIWQQMPLAAQLPARGQKNKEKMHAELRDFKSATKEASSFCRELGIKSLRHLDADSFKQVCREMGKFLAAQTFLTHCPAIVMDLPPAAIHDSKAHLRERAICDERISLPLSAFKDLDTIYPKLRAQFGSHNAMVEVKMNWRCTNEIWWCALVTDEALAARCYRKLGYADADDMVVRMREASRYRHPLCPPSPSSRWTMWSAWRLTPTRSSTSPPSSPMLSGGSWSAAWS